MANYRPPPEGSEYPDGCDYEFVDQEGTILLRDYVGKYYRLPPKGQMKQRFGKIKGVLKIIYWKDNKWRIDDESPFFVEGLENEADAKSNFPPETGWQYNYGNNPKRECLSAKLEKRGDRKNGYDANKYSDTPSASNSNTYGNVTQTSENAAIGNPPASNSSYVPPNTAQTHSVQSHVYTSSTGATGNPPASNSFYVPPNTAQIHSVQSHVYTSSTGATEAKRLKQIEEEEMEKKKREEQKKKAEQERIKRLMATNLVLPHVSRGNWAIMSEVMGKSEDILTWKSMAKRIEVLNKEQNWNLQGLKDFKEHASLQRQTPATFENLQQILREAPKLLKYETISFFKSSYGTSKEEKIFTNKDILSFLTLSFFCCYPVRDTKNSKVPSINFHELYINMNKKTIQAKMNCLWAYLTAATREPENRYITFTRRSLSGSSFPKWEDSDCSISDVKLSDKPIEEYEGKALEVDFANKYIGGGVLATGTVQEEIRMVLSPEMIAARYFNPRMEENEVLFITGAKRYSSYSGYADTFQFTGSLPDKTGSGHLNPRVVAMDAVHYRNKNDQFSKSEIDRELNKAYAGFKPLEDDHNPMGHIATGHWGCGIFNGDKELKAIIQLLAASQAKRRLIYCMTEPNFKFEFDRLVKKIRTHDIKVKTLYKIIVDFDPHQNTTVFGRISHLIDTHKTGPKIEDQMKKPKGLLQRAGSFVKRNLTGAGQDTSSKKINCKYGATCYRKNEDHIKEFAHPNDSDWQE